jgi:hypothetical protein
MKPIAVRRILTAIQRDVPRGGAFYLCRAADGPTWWDVDEALQLIPGRRGVLAPSHRRWHAIPKDQMPALEAITERYPNSVIVHNTQ